MKMNNVSRETERKVNNMSEERRIKYLKKMHQRIIDIGDEDLYATWIELGVPDEPSEDDFRFIASEIELYYDIVELFVRLDLYETKQYKCKLKEGE